jgi:hypothetical protein
MAHDDTDWILAENLNVQTAPTQRWIVTQPPGNANAVDGSRPDSEFLNGQARHEYAVAALKGELGIATRRHRNVLRIV